MSEICAICRRNHKACLCASRLMPPEIAQTPSGDPVPARTIESKADLDMVHYYNRDAVGMRKRLLEQHRLVAELQAWRDALDANG